MWNGLRGASLAAMMSWALVSCNSAAKQSATPLPEAEQAISAEMKSLYMAAAAAAPQSPAQHKVLLQMAQGATNGKELLLTMRAASGVFPAGTATGAETEILKVTTGKMMQAGTLNQMIEFATQYPVYQPDTRAYAQRMFRLGEGESDARSWYRIRAAASHLKVQDLEQQAQSRAEQLAKR